MGRTSSRGKSNWLGFMQEAAAIKVSRALCFSGPAATDEVVTGPLGCTSAAAVAAAAADAGGLPLPRDLIESRDAELEVRDRPAENLRISDWTQRK